MKALYRLISPILAIIFVVYTFSMLWVIVWIITGLGLIQQGDWIIAKADKI